MKRPPVVQQAAVQREVLWALSGRPTPSVKALAERINANRVSVSRALHVLEGRGMVQRDGRSWSITTSGQVAAGELTGVSRAARKMAAQQARVRTFAALESSSIGRMAQQALDTNRIAMQALDWNPLVTKALANLDMDVFRPSHADMLAKALPTLNAGLTGADMLAKALPNLNAGLTGADMLAKALPNLDVGVTTFGADLANLRIASLDTLNVQGLAAKAGLLAGSAWSPVFTENLDAVSRIAANVNAIADLATDSRDIAGLQNAVGTGVVRVGRAYNAHVAGVMDDLRFDEAAYDPRLARSIISPSIAVAGFTGAGRAMLEPPGRTADDTGWEYVVERLEAIGAASAANALRGAWARVDEGGADWERAAGHGGREALRLSLKALAAGSPGNTRRDKIRFIVGDSGSMVKVADGLFTSWDNTYQALSDIAHADEKRWRRQTLIQLLVMAGAIVGLLADHAEDTRRQ